MNATKRCSTLLVLLFGALGCNVAAPPEPTQAALSVTRDRVTISAALPTQEVRVGYTGPASSSVVVAADVSDGRMSVSPVSAAIEAGGEAVFTITADLEAIVTPLSGTVTFHGAGVPDVTIELVISIGCTIEPGVPLSRPASAAWTAWATPLDHVPLDHVPGELLVTYHQPLLSRSGAAETATRRQLSADVSAATGVVVLRSGAAGTHDLVVAPDGDLDAAAARLAADPRVRRVSRNHLAHRLALPDEHYGAQWYLWEFGVEETWSVEDASGTGDDVVIAIVDDGLNLSHVDLAGKALPGRDVFCDDDDVRSYSDHGTHVAGIALAESHPQGLVVGVARGERARLLPVKVFADDSSVGTLDAIVRGIRWSAGLPTDDGAPPNPHVADIINLSLGFGSLPQDAIDMLQETVDEVSARGILVLAAAGNTGSGDGVLYPARLERVVAVGSVDWEFTRSEFSNYGLGLDLMAPGGTAPADVIDDGVCLTGDRHALVGAAMDGARALSCQSGTSMASAFVAGTAALLIAHDEESYRRNPGAVFLRLVSTALQPDTYTLDAFGFGLVCPDAVFGLATACTLPPDAFGP